MAIWYCQTAGFQWCTFDRIMPLMIIKDIVCGQESHEESISVGLIGWKPVQKIQLSISNQEYGTNGHNENVIIPKYKSTTTYHRQ